MGIVLGQGKTANLLDVSRNLPKEKPRDPCVGCNRTNYITAISTEQGPVCSETCRVVAKRRQSSSRK